MALSLSITQFGVVATVIAGLLTAYALFVEPVWGLREYRRLAATRESDPAALVRFYRLSLLVEWGWVALIVAAVAAAPGLRAADIGITPPRDAGLAYGLVAALAVALVVTGLMYRRTAGRETTRLPPGQQAVMAMLPRTARERRYALAMAITAGVCEEVLYRGFFIAAGVGLLGLPVWGAAIVSLAVFVVAHIYQGWLGVIGVTGLAVALTSLYVLSGSLLLPIVLHVLVDIRGLLLVPAPPAPKEPAGPAGSA
jgi:membrane protease YdiL (CAAX protease family)